MKYRLKYKFRVKRRTVSSTRKKKVQKGKDISSENYADGVVNYEQLESQMKKFFEARMNSNKDFRSILIEFFSMFEEVMKENSIYAPRVVVNHLVKLIQEIDCTDIEVISRVIYGYQHAYNDDIPPPETTIWWYNPLDVTRNWGPAYRKLIEREDLKQKCKVLWDVYQDVIPFTKWDSKYFKQMVFTSVRRGNFHFLHLLIKCGRAFFPPEDCKGLRKLAVEFMTCVQGNLDPPGNNAVGGADYRSGPPPHNLLPHWPVELQYRTIVTADMETRNTPLKSSKVDEPWFPELSADMTLDMVYQNKFGHVTEDLIYPDVTERFGKRLETSDADKELEDRRSCFSRVLPGDNNRKTVLLKGFGRYDISESADRLVRFVSYAENFSLRRVVLVILTMILALDFRRKYSKISSGMTIAKRRNKCLSLITESTLEPFVTITDVEKFFVSFFEEPNTSMLMENTISALKEVIPGIQEYYNPRTLKDLARYHVRKSFRKYALLQEQIPKLPIPISIQNFILFKNIKLEESLEEPLCNWREVY